MPGPAPSPNARRRNDSAAWRTLPHRCDMPAPAWPVKGRKPAGLLDLWAHLWTLPVAAIWHEQDASRLVARYALLVIEGERSRDVNDVLKLAAEVRQIEDRLLISPSTRLRARVLVDEAPTVAPIVEVATSDDRRAARLRAVV